jgi:hypothetical protein
MAEAGGYTLVMRLSVKMADDSALEFPASQSRAEQCLQNQAGGSALKNRALAIGLKEAHVLEGTKRIEGGIYSSDQGYTGGM